MKTERDHKKDDGPPRPFNPYRIFVPFPLLAAFARLRVEPVLVGGGAVQVGTGKLDGPFLTGDLDFITSITLSDLGREGLKHSLKIDGILNL